MLCQHQRVCIFFGIESFRTDLRHMYSQEATKYGMMNERQEQQQLMQNNQNSRENKMQKPIIRLLLYYDFPRPLWLRHTCTAILAYYHWKEARIVIIWPSILAASQSQRSCLFLDVARYHERYKLPLLSYYLGRCRGLFEP
jgi:hypothetical protein